MQRHRLRGDARDDGQVQRRDDPRPACWSPPRAWTTAESGVVVDYSSEPPVVTDGPYGETKELFGGFCILDVARRRRRSSGPSGSRWPVPGIKTEIRRVADDRRVPAGQRVDPEGAGVARGDRPALSGSTCDGDPHRPRGRRGGLADRVGADRRCAGPLHRRLRARRGRRPGGAGRGAGHLAARRRTRATPRLVARPTAGAGRSTRSAGAPPSTSGTPRSRTTWARAATSRGARPSTGPR